MLQLKKKRGSRPPYREKDAGPWIAFGPRPRSAAAGAGGVHALLAAAEPRFAPAPSRRPPRGSRPRVYVHSGKQKNPRSPFEQYEKKQHFFVSLYLNLSPLERWRGHKGHGVPQPTALLAQHRLRRRDHFKTPPCPGQQLRTVGPGSSPRASRGCVTRGKGIGPQRSPLGQPENQGGGPASAAIDSVWQSEWRGG